MVTCPKCNESGLHFEQRGGDLRLYTKDRLRHLCSGGKEDMFEKYEFSHPAVEQMTIRDHFAAAALTGLLSYSSDDRYTEALNSELSNIAYELADEMLKIRDKK